MSRQHCFIRLFAVVALTCSPLIMASDGELTDNDAATGAVGAGLQRTIDGLSDGLERTGSDLSERLSAAGAELAEGLTRGLGDTSDGLRAVLSGSSSGLIAALGRLNSGGSELLQRLSGRFVVDVPGTRHFEFAVRHQGLGRRVVVIRPDADPDTLAPVLVLLHYANGNAAHMANLTRAGKLASDYGAWVLLPEAVNGQWRENPNGLDVIDDVGFLDAVITTALADYPLDPARVYAAGMSKGGFMATRFACQGQTPLAGLAIVAGSMRRQQALQCPNDAPLRVMTVHGTDDGIVPYDGRFGLFSAGATFAHWEAHNDCDSGAASEETLPTIEDDGTHVRIMRNEACADGSGVALTTVEGGGHTWPGSDPIFGSWLGAVSGNIDATAALWRFLDAPR